MSVVALSDVQTHLNNTDSGDATELQAFTNRAEAILGQRIGPIGSTSQTERVRGLSSVLQLSHSPIISLTTVTSIDGTTIPTTQLTALSYGRVEYKQWGYFPSRFYDVVYAAGYDPLPDDLKYAVLELVRALWETQRGNQPSASIGAAPVEEGQVLQSFGLATYDLPPRVQQLITPYLPILGA
jgi:hypothetical protein